MATIGDGRRRANNWRFGLLGFGVVTLLFSFGYFVLGTIAICVAAFVALVTIDAELTRTEMKAREIKQDLHNAYFAKQQILDLSIDVICTLDRQGRFAEVSPACEALWGYTPRELIGRPWTEHLHPNDRQKTLENIKATISERSTRTFENRYIHKAGSVVDVQWSARWSPQTDITFCVARDVTGRNRKDERLPLALVGR